MKMEDAGPGEAARPIETAMPARVERETVGQFLRSATRSDHEAVDAAFGSFRLDTRAGYARFLQAHAAILPAAERSLSPGSLVEGWQGRSAALASDLAALGLHPPAEVDLRLPAGEAARWGATYVLEGSRLGGTMLRRMIPAALPSAFLDAGHGQGAWRGFLGALDAAETGPEWRQQALLGARALFAAYLDAAQRHSPIRTD